MKGFPATATILLVISMSLAAMSAAQNSSDHANPQAAQPSSQASDTIPSGTVLAVELSKSLDAKKSKPDDKVEGKTASDLLLHGQIVVPRNTKIVGHVTEAKAYSKASPSSEIKFVFDRMVLKGGREIPLRLTVQAVARPLNLPTFGNLGPASLGEGSTDPGQPPSIAPQTSAANASAGTVNARRADDLNPPPSGTPDMSSTSTTAPLGATSRGVVGIKGLALDNSGEVSVLTSSTGNVRLDSGSQLALRVQ